MSFFSRSLVKTNFLGYLSFSLFISIQDIIIIDSTNSLRVNVEKGSSCFLAIC